MALVLVVDDEARVREVLSRMIQQSGHEVIEADCSDAALEVMASRPADVVFADIQMPGRDGRWLTVEIRKQYPLTPVVLATSVADLEPALTLRYGVLNYLLKPFDGKAVRAALEAAVKWHDEAVTAERPADDPDKITAWLDSLDL